MRKANSQKLLVRSCSHASSLRQPMSVTPAPRHVSHKMRLNAPAELGAATVMRLS